MLRSAARRLLQFLSYGSSVSSSGAVQEIQLQELRLSGAGRLSWFVSGPVHSAERTKHLRRPFHTSLASLKALEVKIASMGESISEGTVAAILKQPGDAVEEDEPILQIETDKVTIDVRAPEAGKVENLLVGQAHVPVSCP